MSSAKRRPPPRIGDAERDRAVDLLGDHLAQGRLSQTEFDERVSVALSAKTAAELEPLFLDLPGPNPGAPAPAESLQDQTRHRVDELATQARARQEVGRTKADPRVLRALGVAAAVAWPVCLLVYFAVGFHLWWLFLVPVALSVALGNLRRGDRPFGRD